MSGKTPSSSSSTQQPSVSQFFKRKSPPPPSSSSLASVKRVKLEQQQPLPSDEVIVLDSDNDEDQGGQPSRTASQIFGLSDDDDIREVHPSAGSIVNSVPAPVKQPKQGASPPRKLPPPSQPIAFSSKSGPSRPPPSLAPIFQSAQAGSRPSLPPPHVARSSSTSTRPIKRSAAAEALRSLAFVDPEDDQGEPIAAPSVAPLSEEEVQARARRHERFATKLLGRTFGRRRSLDLDEAEERGGLGGSDDMGGKSEGEDEVMALDEDSSDGAQPPAKKGKMAELKKKLLASSSSKATLKKKAAPKIGPSGLSYTPLELQVKSLKEANPGVLLIFEVGYKFRFFGEDSKTAAKILNIVAFPDRNFYTASIPVHRLFIHVRNLIANGLKVGVVRQTETAALKKVGTNKSAPFTRNLTELYTSSTWVDDLASNDDGALGAPVGAAPPSNALIAIVELPVGKGKGRASRDEDDVGSVKIGLISVVPSTGDAMWDEFIDGAARTELETRITHIQPQEILLPVDKLSPASEKLLEQILSPTNSGVRFERIRHDMGRDDCLKYVSQFWKKAKGSNAVDKVKTTADFPDAVVMSLAYAVRYLEDFKLSSSLSHADTTFRRFSTQTHMLLNANTLANLEVYRNDDDGGAKGTLMWLLDSTSTKMGRRLLREWVGRPLVDKTKLDERIEAVAELASDSGERVVKIKSLLKNLPDLARGLVRIQSSRATPAELISILKHFEHIAVFYETASTFFFNSPLLDDIVESLPALEEPLSKYIESIHEWKARDNDKSALWKDKDKYSNIEDARDMIMFCDHELTEELEEIRKVMKRPKVVYATVAGVENLIEVWASDEKKVPAKWVRVSSTKNVVRYHTPEVLRITQEREQHRETLAAEADKAFAEFLSEVNESYDVFRTVANHITTLDCLLSLANTSNLPGYSKPVLTDEHQLVCEEAFHPMVAALSDDAYVPNNVNISASHGRTKIITGPNMGGKSSMVRTLALIVMMAQIGSYVPATSVKLGVHDAIFTRMGASDDLLHGRSTFMVEISETSDVIRQASSTSLVILDELGRGTSTYDGQALAEERSAVLYHLVTKVQCNTLFITHYPLVATSLAKLLSDVSNWHMGFSQRLRPDGSSEITFLYRLAAGLAKASFGIECARLAGVPDEVLASARTHAGELETKVGEKTAAVRSRRMADVLQGAFDPSVSGVDDEKTVRKARLLLGQLQ